VPGLSGSMAQIIPNAQTFLGAIFQGVTNLEGLGQYKFNTQVSTVSELPPTSMDLKQSHMGVLKRNVHVPQACREEAPEKGTMVSPVLLALVQTPINCYNGPGNFPAARPCCDPLDTSMCPYGAVNFNEHPDWKPFSNRALNPRECNVSQTMQPSSASPPPMAPPPPTSSNAAKGMHKGLVAVAALAIAALSM